MRLDGKGEGRRKFGMERLYENNFDEIERYFRANNIEINFTNVTPLNNWSRDLFDKIIEIIGGQ